MPITRTAMVDDDGSGTTGTIINNAWKTELYNQIDALVAGAGTWTPTDFSGAGLALTVTSARYLKIDKLVIVTAHFSYPTTANGSSASIGGLPFTTGPAFGGLYSGQSPVDNTYIVPPAGTAFAIINAATGTPRTNAQLTGAVLVIAGVYLTA